MSKKDERIAELEAEVRRLSLMVDVDLSYKDLEMKMRDGTIDLHMVTGEENRPAMKWLAAMMLHAAIGEGEFETEPPNYSTVEISLTPAGQCVPIRASLEVIKPGGKTSHEIRTELEARLADRELTR